VSPGNAELIEAFARHLALHPTHTRAAYVRDVIALARLCADAPIERQAQPALRRHLAVLHARGLSGRSLARTLSAWRAFYRFLLERDATLESSPCTGLRAPRSTKRLPAALTPDEAVRLVSIDGDDLLAVRDRALLELAYSSGLRLAELAGLDIERIDLEAGEVRVLGKGSKERVVPVGAAARAALARWLAAARTVRRRTRRSRKSAHHRAATRRVGARAGAVATRLSAHAAALVRVPSAAVVRRSARGAGDARPREHREHAGVHAPRLPGAREGVRRSASARAPRAQALTPTVGSSAIGDTGRAMTHPHKVRGFNKLRRRLHQAA
jgi:site-specific recombinase XerC